MFENHEQIPSQKMQRILKCLPFCTLIFVFQPFLSFQRTQVIFSSFSIAAKAGKIIQDFG